MFRIDDDTLEVTLLRGQSFLVKAGCVSVMSGHLNILAKVNEDDVSMNEVILPIDAEVESAKFTIGSPSPGTIVEIRLDEVKSWIVRDGSFLAATVGVRIEERYNLKDDEDESFVDQVVAFTKVSGQGSVFVGAFGKAHRHDIDAGDSLLVNGGLFIAAPESMRYSPKPAGSLFTSIAGVSWVLLNIEGPTTVFTQSYNLESFAAAIEGAQQDGGGSDSDSGSSSSGSSSSSYETDDDEEEEEEDEETESEEEEETDSGESESY